MDYMDPKSLIMDADDTAAVKFEDVLDFISPWRKTKALVKITSRHGGTKEHSLISSDGAYWFELKTGNLAEGELASVISRAYLAWINGAFEP